MNTIIVNAKEAVSNKSLPLVYRKTVYTALMNLKAIRTKDNLDALEAALNTLEVEPVARHTGIIAAVISIILVIAVVLVNNIIISVSNVTVAGDTVQTAVEIKKDKEFYAFHESLKDAFSEEKELESRRALAKIMMADGLLEDLHKSVDKSVHLEKKVERSNLKLDIPYMYIDV